VSREHRLSLTGSRWDIRWLSGRGKTPTLCVFPVVSAFRLWKSVVTVAVTGILFPVSCLASEGADVLGSIDCSFNGN
jgi:hypothetical protein